MPLRSAQATLAAVFGALTGLSVASDARATGGDAFELVAFAPPDSTAALHGREVALRFGLGRRYELTLQVNNAFSAQNRRAIAHAEAAIAAIPGVWGVTGPAGLLEITTDEDGRPSSGPLLAGGSDEEANEAVRQRLIRRSDAIGWFVSRDGTQIRLLVDAENIAPLHGALEAAAASSGLVLLSGGAPLAPLWPDPLRPPRPFAPWLPFTLLGLSLAPAALGIGLGRRIGIPRTLAIFLGVAIAAAAPGALSPASGLRKAALFGGLAAGLLVLVTIGLGHVRWAGRRSAPRGRGPVPLTVLLLSLLLIGGALLTMPRLTMGTQLWRQTPLFFVSVRGDMEEPVVLRELRRMTDFLRAEAGVAHAWSVADLFFAVPAPGETFGGIPASPDHVRSILARARGDSAVRLELAPDHRTALVGVRLDDESGVDRLVVLRHLRRYLDREHRAAVLRVEVWDPRLSPSLRGLAKGILAADTRERVLRICERSGRILSDADIQNVERAVRHATLIPAVDPSKLRSEIAQMVSSFFSRRGSPVEHAELSRLADRQKLVEALASMPADATVADLSMLLTGLWGDNLSRPVLRARAAQLYRRWTEVRRLNSARVNFNDILYGADLPTEGVLSEEVRDATLDAMGPVAGVPVGPNVPGAFAIEADAVGGVACDAALSAAWLPRLQIGILVAAALLGMLLLAVGGLWAFAWLPPALAAGMPVLVIPAIARLPIGVLSVAVLAGALGGGAAMALAFAPGRRDR